MKKSELIILGIFASFIFIAVGVNACNLNVSMINQDPYPAIPGESVKLVFQINGVSDPTCGTVNFEVKENFPFTVDPESVNPITIQSGTYTRKYSSFYLAPYKIRIDKDALKGDTPLEVLYSTSSSSAKTLQEFTVYVEDTRADFEIYVKDYNSNTRTLTFEILNIADVDVQALTVEIPKQDSIEIKGANREVIGDLDSQEYTTADFEAIMKGEEINLNIIYTDSINVRREINKTVAFDPSYFNGLSRDQKSFPYWIIIVILVVVGFFIWRVYSKKRKRRKLQHK